MLTQAGGHTHRVVPEDTRARERQAPTTLLLRQVQVKVSGIGLSAAEEP